jgi:hypothetical protein
MGVLVRPALRTALFRLRRARVDAANPGPPAHRRKPTAPLAEIGPGLRRVREQARGHREGEAERIIPFEHLPANSAERQERADCGPWPRPPQRRGLVYSGLLPCWRVLLLADQIGLVVALKGRGGMIFLAFAIASA